MPDTQTTYTAGDSVISTCCLITNPSIPDIRVEIPAASRGTVVAVNPDYTRAPYAVVFEAGHGGYVEIQVSATQIGRVTSHEPLVPVLFEEPEFVHPFWASLQYPHRWCKRLHEVIVLLGITLYGLVLSQEPFMVLTVSGLILLAAYIHQFAVCRTFTLVPESFRRTPMEEDEGVTVCVKCGRRAAMSDLLLIMCMTSLVVHYAGYRLLGEYPDVALLTAHIVLVGAVWLGRIIAHLKIVHLYPKHN